MKWTAFLGAAGLVLHVFAGSPAHAAFIPWTYSWTRNPIIIAADNHGTGGIAFTQQMSRRTTNSTGEIVATNLMEFSSASNRTPDRLRSGSYHLTITLHDDTSNTSGKLTFGGVLSGTFWINGVSLQNTFTSPKIQKIHLGHFWYTVSLASFVAPTTTKFGMITAHVSVVHNPEPSTLVLAGLGATTAGLVCWRRFRSQNTRGAES